MKVLDFGIAHIRDLSANEAITKTGMAIGTPAFMAPEQARGLQAELGPRTDLWAVGATMFTLLTGRHVHDGAHIQAQIIQAASRPAPKLASLIPNVPPEVASIVDRALEFDRAQRWSSAREMQEAIRVALRGLKASEAGLGFFRPARGWLRAALGAAKELVARWLRS